jgi:ABC-2 type transport system ATP-binding protein
MVASVPAVEARALSRDYGDRHALDAVSLAVAPGEIFALLGPNGGGKTTLFRILATLMAPTSGSFAVFGRTPADGVRELRRVMGVVFQNPGLDRKLGVRENLEIQGALYGLSGRSLARRIDAALESLGVLDRAGDAVETLSGGLARRVEIAKALLHEPRVLLLDEPSTGLDPGARRDLRELLRRLSREEGTTVLLTTHLFEEAEAADRIGLLDRGRLVALDTPAALKARVGGDVITLETDGPAEATRLSGEVAGRFAAEAGRVSATGSAVRLELPQAHTFVPRLVEAFPGRFRAVTLGAPSLEDVFVDLTGRRFRDSEDEAAA